MSDQSNTPPAAPRKIFRPRRLALLASVAGLSMAVLAAGPVANYLPAWTASAHAAESTAQAPTGFADLVSKVKPAVISVRVNIVAGRQARGNSPFPQDSPLDRFFRRFGVPDGTPDNSQGQRRNRVTG